MGLWDKVIPQSLKNVFTGPSSATAANSTYTTFTESSPRFSEWSGTVYEHDKTRAIIDRISTACSKLKPEFVTPDGSAGAIPRVQRLIEAWPNDMQTWPDLLKLVSARLYTDTVAYIVKQYDVSGATVGIWSLRPSSTELVEYDGEPWLRFTMPTGEVHAYLFYDVAILTRFQMSSDVFGGGNGPLTPTLRLMDAQRQAEEIALKTGADIRFVGKVTTNMHEDDLERYRNRFGSENFGPGNKSRLILHDNRIEDLRQVDPQHYTVDTDEMERIDKALYAYFGINEDILTAKFDSDTWASFYELTVEPFGIQAGEKLSQIMLTPTQVRKGNRIMFSSSYLEYASTDSKIKVANLLTTTGSGTRNEVRDIFQLPRDPNGDVYMVRGEYYVMDRDNNIIAESGGRTEHDTTWHDDLDDLDEPDDTQTEGL